MGSASQPNVTVIEELNSKLAPTAKSITLAGNDQSNMLEGGDGDDILYGVSGVDVLDGGIGSNTMVGGTGNDIYNSASNDDKVADFAFLITSASALGAADFVM